MAEETQDEVVETTTSTDEVAVEEATDDTEDVEALKQKLADAEEAKRQLTARAHKAEGEVKALKKPKPAEATQTLTPPSDETVAAMVLKSQGKSDEDIAYLKKIAAVNGTNIIDAQKDELYTAYEAKKEAAAKSEQASLGASKGSGAARKQKTTTTAGLTPEEHKELWRKQNGL